MSRDKWSDDDHAQFVDTLRELVDERFPDVTLESARKVFDEVLQNLSEKESEPEIASGWTGKMSGDTVHPLAPESAATPVAAESAAVQIVGDTLETTEGILEQMLEVGAILVKLDPQPELNELVAVRVEFPDAHLTVETDGRVVNNSRRGTAIEMLDLDREDRVALQAIREDTSRRLEERDRARSLSESDTGSANASDLSPADSMLEPGTIPVVQEQEDPRRSFAPLTSRRHGPSSTRQGTGRRRMVQSTTRRQVDLPDPDMHVATSTRPAGKKKGTSTREFYGPPPQWREPKGDADRIEELAEERVVDILLQLSEDAFTGVLIYEVDGEQSEQLVFDTGYVVEWAQQPRTTEQELGPMLLAADRITRRQLAMAAAHADELGLTVARSLMELGILNPAELRHAIAGRLTFLMREFCERKKGAVHIFDSEALPAGFLPQPPLRVHVAAERVIYDRLFRRHSQKSADDREARMEDVLDTYPEIVEHERDRLERAIREQEQLQMIDRVITGRKRMREVMTESSLSPSETFAVLFSLHRMGLLRFDRSLHNTVVKERLRENITVKYLSVHKASYFEVLNVHWSSYAEVVEEAYQRLKKQFDPGRIPDELEDEVHQKVSEINERLEAAYTTLAKRKTRHAYRTRIMPEYKLDHAIPLFLKQCELAERRQQWDDAYDAVRRVLDIDPDHSEAQRKKGLLEQFMDGRLSPNPADTTP